VRKRGESEEQLAQYRRHARSFRTGDDVYWYQLADVLAIDRIGGLGLFKRQV